VYRFWLFVHIAGLLGFVGAHGVSAAVGLGLRRERDPERIRAMLELSAATRVPMYASLALLLTGGLVNGFLGHWWGQGWIWFALGLFVAMAATLVGLAVPYYRRVRACLERRDIADSRTRPPAAVAGPSSHLARRRRGAPHDSVADDLQAVLTAHAVA